MATLPGITFTLPQFGLGIQNPAGQVAAVIGPCASGSANYLYVAQSVQGVKNAVLAGPAAEVAANILQNAGGTVFIVPTSAAALATSSSITSTFAQNVTCSYSASTSPYDSYNVIVNVVSGGALVSGAATLQYSLDGGNNYNPTVVLPTNSILQLTNTGIGLTFTGTGGLTAGDTLSFSTVAPGINSSVVSTALTNLQASSSQLAPFQQVVVCGQTGSSGTAAAAVGSTIVTAVDGWVNNFDVFTAALFEANNTDTAINNVIALNAISDTRTMACGGTCDVDSALTGRLLQKRNVLYAIAPRNQEAVLATSLEFVGDGALPGVVAIYDDQQQNSTYLQGRVAALRTITGNSGFYVAKGVMLSQPGSDYSVIQNRKVADQVCRVAFQNLSQLIGASLLLNSNGTIQTQEAKRIQQNLQYAISNALTGNISSVSVLVDTTNNIASTSTLNVTIQIVPLGTIDQINVTVEFALSA